MENINIVHFKRLSENPSYIKISPILQGYCGGPGGRHAKRLNFDTSGFLEDPKLTRKQCDSWQNIYGDKPKNQRFSKCFYTFRAQIHQFAYNFLRNYKKVPISQFRSYKNGMHQKINPSLPENWHSFYKYDTSGATSATGFSHVCREGLNKDSRYLFVWMRSLSPEIITRSWRISIELTASWICFWWSPKLERICDWFDILIVTEIKLDIMSLIVRIRIL